MTVALVKPPQTAAHDDGAPAIVATVDAAQAAARVEIWRASDAAFDAWLKQGETEATALRRMALGRWSNGNPRLASVMLATAVAIDAARSGCWLDLGFTLQAIGEMRQAVLALQKGLALEPGAARGWLALGLVANQLGDAERAEQAFEAALQGDPSLSDAAFGLGLVAFDRRRYAKAAAAFRQALDLGATMPIARVGLGQSLFFLGEFAEAARELRTAVAAGAEASLIRRAALANYIAEALKGDFAAADRLYEEIAGAGGGGGKRGRVQRVQDFSAPTAIAPKRSPLPRRG